MNRTLPTAAAVAIAALSLAACKKNELIAPPPKPPPSAARDAAPAASASADVGSQRASALSEQAPDASPTPQPPMLAMAYRLGLAVPADQVRPLMESHQEACERAGSDQCQVMAASAEAEQGDRATASLTLRA